MKNKKQQFNNLLDELKNIKEINEEFKYIGTGNPNSKILIVGKETATDVDNKANGNELDVLFENESLQDFKENTVKWDLNIKNNVVFVLNF